MWNISWAALLLMITLCSTQVTPPPVFPLQIGNITLANSGAPAAQENFTNGVLLMLNFWYPLAITTFQEAQQIDPTFAMAYWGEALAQTEFLWEVENVTLSASILDKIDMVNWPMMPKEEAYINAARELYNVSLINDRPQRLLNFIGAMEAMIPLYGQDDEIVNTTYGLARMGYFFWGYMTWQQWNESEFWSVYELFNELSVYNPQNPAAWHFIIHSCDDAFHYMYAEQAAFTYPLVASSSSHAQHMPSHIWIRYGWWTLVALRNEYGWAEQYEFCNLTGLNAENYDYHSNWYLMYAYLMMGQYDNAAMALGRLKEYLGPDPDALVNLQAIRDAWGAMAGAFILATERWSDAYATLPPLLTCSDCLEYEAETDDGEFATRSNSQMLLVRGLASIRLGNDSDVTWVLNEIETQIAAYSPFQLPVQLFNISALQIRASVAANTGDYTSAIAYAEEAAAIEISLGSPSSGPPIPVQPSIELLGNVYYTASQYGNALTAYEQMQALIPNRTTTLLGIARAGIMVCNYAVATTAYSMLSEILANADAGNSARGEALMYLATPPTACNPPTPPPARRRLAYEVLIVAGVLIVLVLGGFVVARKCRGGGSARGGAPEEKGYNRLMGDVAGGGYGSSQQRGGGFATG